MLVNLDIPWVILGHSERRALLGESNEVLTVELYFLFNMKFYILISILIDYLTAVLISVRWRESCICSFQRSEGHCLYW